MDKIVVFGGAGYIGSHTCKCLAEQGFQPIVFDNLSEGHRHFVKWGPLVEADIMDSDRVTEVLRDIQPTAIIHFAAHAYVGESIINPAKYYTNNVTGSLNVIQAAHQAGDIPIIFSSTCATYGLADRRLISEEVEQKPINPYGRSKLMVEHILRDYSNAFGLDSVSLRYFNACGADQDGEIGESHRDETHLIPRAIFSALGRIDDFSIFGDNYPTPDGTAIRDYIHVTDLAIAHVKACQYVLNGGGQAEAFNIGSGKGFSVLEICKAIEAQIGSPIAKRIAPRREGDPPFLVANHARAKEVLGFSPEHSDLNNIIETAVRWHLENP